MPDPFVIILALTAVATVILWPVRMWILSRYGRRDDDDESDRRR